MRLPKLIKELKKMEEVQQDYVYMHHHIEAVLIYENKVHVRFLSTAAKYCKDEYDKARKSGLKKKRM